MEKQKRNEILGKFKMRYSMELLKLKKRKTIILYMVVGLFHCLSTIYISSHTLNGNVWAWLAVGCIIIVSLLEKKQRKENYILVLITGVLVTFMTSLFLAVVLLIFTPVTK